VRNIKHQILILSFLQIAFQSSFHKMFLAEMEIIVTRRMETIASLLSLHQRASSFFSRKERTDMETQPKKRFIFGYVYYATLSPSLLENQFLLQTLPEQVTTNTLQNIHLSSIIDIQISRAKKNKRKKNIPTFCEKSPGFFQFPGNKISLSFWLNSPGNKQTTVVHPRN
jgi:hypothetical protein